MDEEKGFVMCLDCGFKISQKELDKLEESKEPITCCPNCKSKGIPYQSSNNIEVKINWHELMCLVMWAERWAIQCRDNPKVTSEPFVHTVYAIADRIAQQFPKRYEDSPLTLMGQIGQVRDWVKEQGGKIQTSFPGIEDASIDLKRE